MRTGLIIATTGAWVVLGLTAATQFIAATFAYQAALGSPILAWRDGAVFPPWAMLSWSARWAEVYPKPFAIAHLWVLCGFGLAFLTPAALLKQRRRQPQFGKDAWASFVDVQDAGLFASRGAVLGKLDGELIAFDGPEHQVLIGASRSGKGRGHVVPTILAHEGSMLILDVKGELDRGDQHHGFPGTSGYRAKFGEVRRFAPTDPGSDCLNILLEVRKGRNEVRDVQNIIDIIVEFEGQAKGAERFWNETAKIILVGVVLHVLYAEPPERKTLAVVREKLRDLDRVAEEMRTTLHWLNPSTGQPEVHPEVRHASESYLAGEDRLRSGIKATAESFFGVFADPIVAEKTSTSSFRLGDLMCAERPMTLYLQPPPSDAQRLMPLVRLVLCFMARQLMESQTHDGHGRLKRHRLLMVLDEFPQLGRLDFFEKMMGAMAGYGIKAYLVCQSLNHITRAYGRENVILDNCGIVTAFAAADPETAKRIADMAGEVWEMRAQESEQRPRSLLGPRKGTITYREERRPLLLPADVRKLPRDEQLIFVSGVKPLKAKKLRFDAEPVFVSRLLPAAPAASASAIDHDWLDVTALGRIESPRKREPAPRTRAARPVAAGTSPPSPQTDLFADAGVETAEGRAPAEPQSTPSAVSISAQALFGFAGRTHPGVAAEEARAAQLGAERQTPVVAATLETAPQTAPPCRRARVTGI